MVLQVVPSAGGVGGVNRCSYAPQAAERRLQRSPQGLRTLLRGAAPDLRQTGSSHAVFKTPWPGDPRVNSQNDKGKAKAYQVRQVLRAIDKKEAK